MSDTYPLLLVFNRCTITCSYITVEIFYTHMFQLPITGFLADFIFGNTVSAAYV